MSRPKQKRPAGKSMSEIVGNKQERRLAARRQQDWTIWFGLGMFGLIGWSVAIPSLIGISVGLWIDHHWPSQYSWTLMLMLFGVGIGCTNAWRWTHRESHIGRPETGTDTAERGDSSHFADREDSK